MISATGFAETSPACRVLFDDIHGQTYGNADWIPSQAYSSMADDLKNYLNASIAVASDCCPDGNLDAGCLAGMDLIILPEPNIRYQKSEIELIWYFIENGGSVFMIADHGESDRNFDGWDSPLILNEIADRWGFFFTGITFSEAPMIRTGKLNALDSVQRVGAWAATTIMVQPGQPQIYEILKPSKQTGAFMIAGQSGKGRFAALGDSSVFDDGTGDNTKNRHSAYYSFLYDHPALAVQTSAWLLDKSPIEIPKNTAPYPFLDTLPLRTGVRLAVDIAHGNCDSDNIDRFLTQLQVEDGIEICFNRRSLDSRMEFDFLVLLNPLQQIPEKESRKICRWVKQGGTVILATNNARNPLNGIMNINRLLTQCKSDMRLRYDEVLDSQSNTGKPWSVKITSFERRFIPSDIDSAVFWGCCSLVDRNYMDITSTKNIQVLAKTSPAAESISYTSGNQADRKKTKADFTVAAFEQLGKGKIILLGANTMSNFQYVPEEDRKSTEQSKWDHRTAEFNLSIVRLRTK